MKEKIIYQSYGFYTSKEIEEMEKEVRERYDYEIDDASGYVMETINTHDFSDIQSELEKIFVGDVLVIANMGLWNGIKTGYKVIENASLDCILGSFSCEDIKVYSDGHNIRSTGCHHDGRNYHLFRAIKNGLNIERLLEDIYEGKTISPQRLCYYTKSLLPEVK